MPKSTVCFDIGSKQLKMVVLEGEKDNFRMLDWAVDALPITQDTPPNDANRIIARTIKNILAEKKIKTKNISLSISGQSVFVRFVKLPAVEESKVEQIIRYEAQQQVPFPIEDVEWDHQIIGSKKGGELDVVLVAIKKEVASLLVEAIINQGFEVDRLDVSTVSLYNCFAFNEGQAEHGSVLIDLGAKTSNLLICAGDKLWARAIPIGGDNFTMALCREMEIEFDQAEEIKKSAMVLTPDLPRDRIGDEKAIQASEALTKIANRLFTEISRSVGYFRSQWPSIKIGRVMLTGGGSFMNNIRQFLTGKLNVSVEDLRPFNKVAPPPGLQQDQLPQLGRQLGDAVGLGLRCLGAGKLATDLLPRSVTQRKELAKKRVFIAAAGVWLIAALVIQGLSMGSKAKTLESSIARNEELYKKDDNTYKKIDKLLQEQRGIETNLKKIKTLQEARLYWFNFMQVLKEKKPKYVWLTSVEIHEPIESAGSSMPGYSPYGPEAGYPMEGRPGAAGRPPAGAGRQVPGAAPGMGYDPQRNTRTRSPQPPRKAPRPVVVLKGYIEIQGQAEELALSEKVEKLEKALASGNVKDGTKWLDNVITKDYYELRKVRDRKNRAIFEIQADLLKPMPEY